MYIFFYLSVNFDFIIIVCFNNYIIYAEYILLLLIFFIKVNNSL